MSSLLNTVQPPPRDDFFAALFLLLEHRGGEVRIPRSAIMDLLSNGGGCELGYYLDETTDEIVLKASRVRQDAR